jgi:hypothetical protein
MSATVGEIKQWIEDAGLTDDSVVLIDEDGALISSVPGRVAMTYLLVGFVETEEGER